MRRIASVLAVASAVVTLAAPSALARGDGWEFFPASSFTLPAEICGFEVQVTPVANKEYIRTIAETDTTVVQQMTGRFVSRLTNLESGRSVTINISGPGTFVVHLDSGVLDIIGRGRWALLFIPADQAQFGVPGIMLLSGHFKESLDLATNDAQSLSYVGHVTDACALLG